MLFNSCSYISSELDGGRGHGHDGLDGGQFERALPLVSANDEQDERVFQHAHADEGHARQHPDLRGELIELNASVGAEEGNHFGEDS